LGLLFNLNENFTDKGLISLGNAFMMLKNLTYLIINFGYCENFTINGLKTFSSFFLNTKEIKKLVLKFHCFTDEKLYIIANSILNLK